MWQGAIHKGQKYLPRLIKCIAALHYGAPPGFSQSKNSRLAQSEQAAGERQHIQWFNFWFGAIDGFGRHNENYISAALFILQFLYFQPSEKMRLICTSVRPAIGGLSLATMHSNFCARWLAPYRPPTCARSSGSSGAHHLLQTPATMAKPQIGYWIGGGRTPLIHNVSIKQAAAHGLGAAVCNWLPTTTRLGD